MNISRISFLAFMLTFLPNDSYSQTSQLPEEFECMLEPHVVSKIGSHVEGVIEDIKVARGDIVGEGQVLVTLKSDLEKATVDLARARAKSTVAIRSSKVREEFGERKQQRSKELLKKHFVSAADLDQANTENELAILALQEARENHKIAQLQLKQAIETLDMKTIRSPLQGVVVELYQAKGERITERPILELAQIDPLNVEVILPVGMLSRVKVGMLGNIQTEASEDKSYIGKVVVVDRVVNAASGMFGVRLDLPNPDNKIPAGLKCKVSFLPDEKKRASLAD